MIGDAESRSAGKFGASWKVGDVAHLLENRGGYHSVFDKINSGNIARCMKMVTVREGALIIKQGEMDDCGLLLVLSGYVIVEKKAHGLTGSKVVAIAGPGEFIGEMQFFDGQPRSASCIAKTDLQLGLLSAAEYRKLARIHPAASHMLNTIISRQQSERLRKTTIKSLYFENTVADSNKAEGDARRDSVKSR